MPATPAATASRQSEERANDVKSWRRRVVGFVRGANPPICSRTRGHVVARRRSRFGKLRVLSPSRDDEAIQLEIQMECRGRQASLPMTHPTYTQPAKPKPKLWNANHR